MRFLPLILLALAACQRDAPPAPTASESAGLDEAEAMLNDAGNEKGPEALASDPSSNFGGAGAE